LNQALAMCRRLYPRQDHPELARSNPAPFPEKANEKPAARQQRLANFCKMPCRSCFEEIGKRQRAAARARKLERILRKEDLLAGQVRGRLPHGAGFVASWDADKTQWTGSLAITVNGTGYAFAASASGIVPLLRLLDDEWRKVEAEADQTEESPTTA
jgi:hypothetical protein